MLDREERNRLAYFVSGNPSASSSAGPSPATGAAARAHAPEPGAPPCIDDAAVERAEVFVDALTDMPRHAEGRAIAANIAAEAALRPTWRRVI